MKCAECGSESYVKLSLSELLPCANCGSDNHMEYYVCFGCGTAWRQYNGKVYGSVSGCIYNDSDNNDFNCIMCQSEAHEVSEGKFECSNPICDFKWEVLKGE